VAGAENVDNDTIPRLHKSFVEYITSKRADPQFRIDVPVVDGQIATKCLRLAGRLRNAGERAATPVGSVRYAVQNWTRHLPGERISESGVGIVGGDAEGLWKTLSTTAALRKDSCRRRVTIGRTCMTPTSVFHRLSTVQPQFYYPRIN
jgi:hypothetical protein